MLASRPFLTAQATDVHLPLLGALHLSSVLVFDFGVYMLVIGATMLMLVALAHQSLRSPRRRGALNAVIERLPRPDETKR